MLAALTRTPLRTFLWLAFFAAILLAWVLLFGAARMSGLDIFGRTVGMNMMPMETWGMLFAMWAVMMAAMMGPTLVPTLTTYEDLMRSADGTRAGWFGVLGGYFIVWIGFAGLIAAVQVALLSGGAIDTLGMAQSGWVAATLLIAVGAYQFTWAKQVCHAACHAPMQYFLARWRTGAVGGLRMGAGLGSFCVGCCWGYMALGFVGGTMSLLWMGLATVVMVLEKLPQIGHYVIRPVGVALILGGLLTALRSAAVI